MLQFYQLLTSAAASDAPVVLYGESGTGKELAAAAAIKLSPRARGPFIKVNSAALNESLLESELFGHIKGAFTGADRTRVGRFEAAHRGSIFLDEIGDLPLATQVKLLRVLQEKTIEKVGDQRPIPVDVRIITATNQDLQLLMERGLFREDLFFRINVIPIHLPPLRERREDIPLLVALPGTKRRQDPETHHRPEPGGPGDSPGLPLAGKRPGTYQRHRLLLCAVQGRRHPA